MGETLTKHLRKDGTVALMAGGLLVCASVFVSPAARADDSLWGKALNTIGLGGSGQPDAAAQPPQAVQAPPAAQPSQAVQAPKPAVQATHPKQSASANSAPAASAPAANAASSANSVTAAAPGEGANLWRDWFGLGRENGSSSPQAAAPAQSVAMQQKAINPVSAPANPAPSPAPPASSNMWDNMLGSVGLGANNPTANVNYSDRPKLTVPKERNLPQPNAMAEPTSTRPASSEALVKPPGDYLEKVKGSDGNVSGLRDSDTAKDKKMFGIF